MKRKAINLDGLTLENALDLSCEVAESEAVTTYTITITQEEAALLMHGLRYPMQLVEGMVMNDTVAYRLRRIVRAIERATKCPF